jgi:hypothetical protein
MSHFSDEKALFERQGWIVLRGTHEQIWGKRRQIEFELGIPVGRTDMFYLEPAPNLSRLLIDRQRVYVSTNRRGDAEDFLEEVAIGHDMTYFLYKGGKE